MCGWLEKVKLKQIPTMLKLKLKLSFAKSGVIGSTWVLIFEDTALRGQSWGTPKNKISKFSVKYVFKMNTQTLPKPLLSE